MYVLFNVCFNVAILALSVLSMEVLSDIHQEYQTKSPPGVPCCRLRAVLWGSWAWAWSCYAASSVAGARWPRGPGSSTTWRSLPAPTARHYQRFDGVNVYACMQYDNTRTSGCYVQLVVTKNRLLHHIVLNVSITWGN